MEEMNPYSHYLLASKAAPFIQPDHPAEYYLGSIIPDVRYLAGMRRDQTHLSREQIQSYRSTYPRLASFLQGFQVHCLIDEIDVAGLVSAAFPLNLLKRLLRKSFSQQQITALAELYFIQSPRMDWHIAENHNEVLTDLGITPSQTQAYLAAMKEYLPSPSFETALSCFQKIGWMKSARAEKYLQAYQSLERNRMVKNLLLMGIRNANLEQVVVNHVRSAIR
jgi:hypothetical protein